MGYPKGEGPRKCPGCLLWYSLKTNNMELIRDRYYCEACKKVARASERHHRRAKAPRGER